MADVVERLAHARTTASNDDFSKPGTPERDRHCERLAAMQDATTEIETLRARLSQAGAGRGVVKPLAWRKYRNGDEEAVTPFGTIYTAYASGYWRTNKAPKFIAAGKDVASAKAGAQASWDDEVRKLIASAALAPSPSAGEPNKEDIARIVYSAMKWAAERAETGKPTEWVDRGNSLAQTQARWFASHITALYATPPATPVQPTASVESEREACAQVAEHYGQGREGIAASAAIAKAIRARASLTPAPTQGDGA